MKLLAKLKQMSDNEILSLYQGFSGYLAKEIQYDAIDVIKNLPGELSTNETLSLIQQADLEKMDSLVKPDEVVPVVRTIMEQWAQDPEKSTVLQQYMETHRIHTMDAGVILAVGSVLVMSIVSSSLKVAYTDGKLSVNYDSSNISNNAVEMVKTVLTKLPESIKSIFHKNNN